jgi:hypothetical protein
MCPVDRSDGIVNFYKRIAVWSSVLMSKIVIYQYYVLLLSIHVFNMY